LYPILFNILSAIPQVSLSQNYPRKGVIEKMADLAEFWLILESELVEHATRGIFYI
jgi:hypothetical protein